MAVAQDSRLQHSLKMEPGVERPQSALARGVQITEFKDGRVNPEPVVLEETDILMEQFLSPRKLRLLTGVDNLDDIRQLEMKVNTTDTSLGNFGVLLPNLRQLKVSNSTIPYIRDLGSSLRSLNVLWASRCALLELDGISSMCNLREIYLSYNEISDISPLSMLDQLEIIDLEGNNIDDIVQIQYLAICSKLTNLTLEGNPMCVAPAPGEESEEYDYRQSVKKAIPHLKTLDDELLIEGVGSFQKHNVFDADWAYLEELQRDITLQDEPEPEVTDFSPPSSGNRPSTAALRPNTGYRPGSALRPSSGFKPLTATRPSSVGGRPATSMGIRPGSGSGEAKPSENVETSDASDLTLGKVICGNPSKALLSRRRLNPDASGDLDNHASEIKFEPKFKHKTEHTYDPLPEESRDRSEIVDELKAWKAEHEKRMMKIRESKAPQVLKIDHDDAVSLSGDSDVETDEEEFVHRMDIENQATEDQNLSSFLPASADVPVSDKMLPNTGDLYKKTRESSTDILDKNDDLLAHANLHDNSFRVLDLAKKHKPVIPPPNERDIVRQQTKGQPRAPSPLGLGGQISGSEVKRSMSPSLRVNTTGLPRPNPSVPLAPRSRLKEETNSRSFLKDQPTQPQIRGGNYDRPVPPPSQRPSTARAALAISAQPKIRRSLPTVPSLPSKPPVPPK